MIFDSIAYYLLVYCLRAFIFATLADIICLFTTFAFLRNAQAPAWDEPRALMAMGGGELLRGMQSDAA